MDGNRVGRDSRLRRIVLVGSPNVGKSVIFNRLTGRYAVVSNYPGTTVEVSRGEALFGDLLAEVVDTPGTYSLLPSSEEEAVTRRLLWHEDVDLVLHVVDTKNLEHSLSLTFALMEAGFQLILVLNMFDEAERLGLTVDVHRLEQRLGIPCVATVGPSGWGVPKLKQVVRETLSQLRGSANLARGRRPAAVPAGVGGWLSILRKSSSCFKSLAGQSPENTLSR
ncbi:MAG: GTP-binding protein [Firmicutes bacterium]|nr:GTP-binding protein [Bacillota bacterium]